MSVHSLGPRVSLGIGSVYSSSFDAKTRKGLTDEQPPECRRGVSRSWTLRRGNAVVMASYSINRVKGLVFWGRKGRSAAGSNESPG